MKPKSSMNKPAPVGRKKSSKQKLRKQIIMDWLKPYLESQDNSESVKMWDQLKCHAEAREWKKFGSVIRQKWLGTGNDKDATRCLDNSLHCLNIWELLNA